MIKYTILSHISIALSIGLVKHTTSNAKVMGLIPRSFMKIYSTFQQSEFNNVKNAITWKWFANPKLHVPFHFISQVLKIWKDVIEIWLIVVVCIFWL